MSDLSPILALPLLHAAQAQKHVTHNEALRILDVLVQPAVLSRTLASPPALPVGGERFILPAGASGAWAGHAGAIAFFDQEAWAFLAPQPGWQAHVLDEGATATWTGTAWATPAEAPAEFMQLGINTAADPTNRLAVAADATLLTHAGTGHQLKLNKATPTDTASLLFQTGWSGRAEMGTAGSDGFAIKTSADGSSWVTALDIAPASGRLGLPQGVNLPAGSAATPALAFEGDADSGLCRPAADQIGLATGGVLRARLGNAGLQLDVPLTGTAVQAGPGDTTPGRLLRVGSFGLGERIGYDGNLDDLTTPGIYGLSGLVTGFPPGTLATSLSGSVLLHHVYDPTSHCQILHLRGTAGDQQATWSRHRNGGTWGAWRMVYDQRSIRGTVSQSGGIPTGALVERGSNANGEYVRFADGTQICTRSASTTSATINPGQAFSQYWSTYPAAFSGAAPVPAFSCIAYENADLTGRAVYTIPFAGNSIAPYWLNQGTSPTDAPPSLTPGSLIIRSYRTFATTIGRWF